MTITFSFQGVPHVQPPAVASASVAAAPASPPPTLAAARDDPSTVPWPWRLYAGLTAYLGLPLIAAWIALTFAAVWFLPDFGRHSGFGLRAADPEQHAGVARAGD